MKANRFTMLTTTFIILIGLLLTAGFSSTADAKSLTATTAASTTPSIPSQPTIDLTVSSNAADIATNQPVINLLWLKAAHPIIQLPASNLVICVRRT